MKILFQVLEFIKNMRCGVCSTPFVEGSYVFRKMSQFRSKPKWILIGSNSHIGDEQVHSYVDTLFYADQTYSVLLDARHEEKSISRRKSHKPVRLALGKSKTYLGFSLEDTDLDSNC